MKKFLTILSLLISSLAFSQVNVGVIGSSTAAGQLGVSSPDSGWVARLQAYYRRNMSDGKDTVVHNHGVNGYTTYNVMRTGNIPPAGRPSPDVNNNVTKLLTYSDLAVAFVNLPTNDIVNGYSVSEYMNNLRTIFYELKAAGARVFITTTQPRMDGLSTGLRQTLRDLVDSINNAFGKYSIDFGTPLATTDGLNNIKSTLNSGDNVHVNDQGQRLLFNQVIAKDLFQPAFITDFYKTGPSSFDGRPARTSLPNDYADSVAKVYPLVIFLHGTGAASLTLDTAKLEMEALPYWIAHGQMPQVVTNGAAQKCIVFCPQHDWFSVGQDTSVIRYLLNDFIARYRVDISRIYVTGLSGGGQGAASFISSYPALTKRIAAAFITSLTGYNHAYERDSLVSAGKLWGVRMWAAVGTLDDFGHGCRCTDAFNRTTDAVNQFNLNGPAVPAIQTNITGGMHDANTVFNPVYDKNWKTNPANTTGKNMYEWFFQAATAPPLTKFPLKVSDAYQTNNVSRDIADLIDDNPSTRFFPTYPTYGVILQPHNVIIDMGDYTPAIVKRLVWYDGSGSGYDCRIVFVRASDGHEDTVATFTGDQFNATVTINIPVQYQYIISKVILRSPSGGDGYPQDLQLWGTFTQHTDPVFARFNTPLRYLMGVNCHPWDIDYILYPKKYQALLDLKLGSARVYFDAYAGKDASGNYRLNPESRGFEVESTFNKLHQDDPNIFTHICYQNQSIPIGTTWAAAGHTSHLDFPYGADRNNPTTYTEIARDMFVLAERGGINASLPDYPLYVGPFYETPQQMTKGGGFYDIIEGGNEWNAWWRGIDGYLSGSQLAAAWSAMYDGHKGTISNAGVKKADSTMEFWPGGLASDRSDIPREVVDWSKKNRGVKPNGNVDVPVDKWNMHGYSSEGGQYGNSTGGLPVEVGLIPQINNMVYFDKKYGGQKGVELSEWGYDVNRFSPLNAPAYGPYTAEQTRGNFAMRGIFSFSEADLYGAEWYRLYQDWTGSNSITDTTGNQIFDSSGDQFVTMALLRNINGAGTVVRRTLVGDYFKQLSEFGDYIYDSTLRNDSIHVIRLRNPATGKRIYALWVLENMIRAEGQRPQFSERTGIYTLNVSGTTRRFVDDGSGVMSSELATNTITIGAKPLIVQEGAAAPIPNQNPSSNAGTDITITLPQSSITLSGSGSDPDGTIASVAWTEVSGAASMIVSPNSNVTLVTGLTEGVYVFRFTVTDNNGATASDTVQVTVNAPVYVRSYTNQIRYIFKAISDLIRVKRKTP